MKLSILITHYNRIHALKDCIKSFEDLNLDLSYEYIVSDDGSDEIHVNELKKLKNVTLVLSDTNLGLGANNNKGLKKCSGKYILYCQDDFLIGQSFSILLKEIITQLDSTTLDMVRLTANYNFPKLIPISENISRIPKLSIKNFLFNAYQYSDHPFIVKNDFFQTNGFYLENVKGSYCETEYCIRMMQSKVKIGILNKYLFTLNKNSESILNYNANVNKNILKNFKYRIIIRFIRAVRFHIEFLFYNSKNRKLITYKKRLHNLVKNISN